MNENQHVLLRPSSIDIKQVESFVLNDDGLDEDDEEQIKEMETDNRSTSDTIIATDEIEAVLKKADSQDLSAALITSTDSRELEKDMYVRAHCLESEPGNEASLLSSDA